VLLVVQVASLMRCDALAVLQRPLSGGGHCMSAKVAHMSMMRTSQAV
jgi:hypothetical protein